MLQRVIVQRFEGGHRNDETTLRIAGSFLQEGALPKARAAFYRLLGQLPGIENLGPVIDRLGRHGADVGLTIDGNREELIFDPATSAFLEYDSVLVAHGGATGLDLQTGKYHHYSQRKAR